MTRSNRKGSLTNLQIAIITIITCIILSVFLYRVYTSLSDKMSVQSCRNSIEAHSLISKGTAREIFTDIKCPTKDITIKGEDPKKIKSIIAEDMHRCWYIWGQGKGEYFEGDGNFCHVCTTYTFEKKDQQITGLMQYLADTPIKMKYPSDTQGITYTQYLKGTKTANVQEMTGRDVDELVKYDTFDTSQQYATIFVYASGKEAIQKALEGGARTTTGIVGLGGVLTGGAAVSVGITAVFLGSNPVGWLIGGGIAIYVGAEMVAETFDVKDPETLQYVAFRPYNAEELNSLDCEKLEVNQMSNAGK